MKKMRTAWIAAVLAAALLLAGCGAVDEAGRHEIYRIYEGNSGDWNLRVRLWVEHDGSMLLPADLQTEDSGTYTRTYWAVTYHGDKSEEELGITELEVGDESWNENWRAGESGGYFDFSTENSWVSDKSYTNGIDVGNSDACYALLTDIDGHTIRIDAPLTRSKG